MEVSHTHEIIQMKIIFAIQREQSVLGRLCLALKNKKIIGKTINLM